MDVLVYGAGLLGKQLCYFLRAYSASQYRVLGFVDDDRATHGRSVVDDLITLGTPAETAARSDYSPTNVRLLLAIGYGNMRARKEAFRRGKDLGYQFAAFIHPRAHVEEDVHLGAGAIILAGAVVDQGVRLADINYLDIGTRVGEQCTIGVNNYLSAGTTIGGSVTIGESNFFGLNTTIVNDLSIGNDNFVNARSLVYRNLGDNCKVVELNEQRVVTRSAECHY